MNDRPLPSVAQWWFILELPPLWDTVPCCSGLGLTLPHDQLWDSGCVKRLLQNPGDHGALWTLQCSPIVHLDFHTLKICAFVSQYLHQHIPIYPVNRINTHDPLLQLVSSIVLPIQARVLSHLWVLHSLWFTCIFLGCMLGRPEVLTQQLSIWGRLLPRSVWRSPVFLLPGVKCKVLKSWERPLAVADLFTAS